MRSKIGIHLAATTMTMRTTDHRHSNRPENQSAARTKQNLTVALIQVANLVVAVPGCTVRPPVASSVKVTCSNICEGRITHGIHPPLAPPNMSIGDYFAACSYLEAASVHAFARLSEELAAYGAPAELLAAIRRAESDEVRHAELTRALARRYGVEPERPSPPPPAARTLFDILRENAIEGCIRETYGAAVALVRAARAKDAAVRKVMRSIARDECRHAELSWRIAAWAAPRLTPA